MTERIRDRLDFDGHWWTTGGPRTLPGGATVTVEPLGDARASVTRLHLNDGVLVELDEDTGSDELVDLSLWLLTPYWAELAAHHPEDQPDDGEATVRFTDDSTTGVIELSVHSDHDLDCGCGNNSTVAQWEAFVEPAGVEAILDALSRLPTAMTSAHVGEAGALLWRGRRSGTGEAVIQRIHLRTPWIRGGTYDSRYDDETCEISGLVDFGLRAPPSRIAVPVPPGTPRLGL